MGFALRRLMSWIARASSSLPVPVSPVISTVASVGATRLACASIFSTASLSPTMPIVPVVPPELLAQVDVLHLQPVAEPLHLLERLLELFLPSPSLRDVAEDTERLDRASGGVTFDDAHLCDETTFLPGSDAGSDTRC